MTEYSFQTTPQTQARNTRSLPAEPARRRVFRLHMRYTTNLHLSHSYNLCSLSSILTIVALQSMGKTAVHTIDNLQFLS
jgi:hypothetical protein